jgi:hypothetical protein
VKSTQFSVYFGSHDLGRQPQEGRDHLNFLRRTTATIYKLNVKDVPVDGFWSISLYNAEGYIRKIRTMPTPSTT